MQRRLAETGVAVCAALDVADVGVAGGTTGTTQRARQVRVRQGRQLMPG